MKIIRRAEQARLDRYPGVPRYALIDSTLGSAGLHVGDLTYNPGSAVPHHNHPDAEETQIMLEGELECWLDGHRFVVKAGDCVVARRGVGHAFFNRTRAAARMITLFAISPPTTTHTPNPQISDGAPDIGVVTNLWPADNLTAKDVERYPVNTPVGAAETRAELLVMAPGRYSEVEPGSQEAGLFCIEGSVLVADGAGPAISLRSGDFLLADRQPVVVRNESDHAATLLAVYSLI